MSKEQGKNSVYVQIFVVVLAFTVLVLISTWFIGDIMNRQITDSITAAFSNTEVNITADLKEMEPRLDYISETVRLMFLEEMRKLRLILIAVGIVLATLNSVILLRLSSVSKERQDIKEEHGLTSREREIFTMLLDGRAPKEIAQSLKISHRTVDTHIANLYRKLGIQSRAELFAKYKTK
jgi:DNA-binding NarL/FixJ family response regulator